MKANRLQGVRYEQKEEICMISNIGKHEKQVICDNCGGGFEAKSWKELQLIMKEEGWKTKKQGDSWANYCPECGKGECNE